jgi:hypothetical protein
MKKVVLISSACIAAVCLVVAVLALPTYVLEYRFTTGLRSGESRARVEEHAAALSLRPLNSKPDESQYAIGRYWRLGTPCDDVVDVEVAYYNDKVIDWKADESPDCM